MSDIQKLTSVADELLNLRHPGKSPNTVAAYRRDVWQYVARCESSGLDPWRIDAVKEYQKYLMTVSSATSSIRRRLCGVRVALKQAARKHLNAAEHAILCHALDTDLRLPKEGATERQIGSGKILARHEVDALIARASRRTALLIETLGQTALRVSELCSLRWHNQVAENGKTITYRVLGKTNKSRRVRISKDLLQGIRDTFHGKTYLFETTGGKPYDRSYVSGEIRKLGQRVLARQIGAHTLRHTWVTDAIRRTGKLKAVSEYAGHASTAFTLDRYVHEELTDEELLQ